MLSPAPGAGIRVTTSATSSRATSGAEPRLPRRVITGYAFGSLGTGGFATLPGLVLVYYMTDQLGIAPLVAGAVVAAAKIWDVLINPLIGALSDTALRRRGSRRLGMLAGALVLPLFFVLTFAVPGGLAPAAAAVWVLFAFLLAATAFSFFQVPYMALPAEITPGYDERTRLLTWRVVALAVAILLFGAGGPMLRTAGGGAGGYLLMSGVAAAVIAAGMLVASAVAPRHARPRTSAAPEEPRVQGRAQYASAFRALRRNQPFRVLLAAFVLQGMATGQMLAGASYVATWILGAEEAVTPLFVALIGPTLLCTPLWGVIARRVGKERAYQWASALFLLAALALGAQIWWPGRWLYLAVGVCGAAYAAMQSLPMAMLPDTISDDARRHGPGQAGIFGGIWTAGETVGMALGAAALAAVLAVGGYRAHTGEVLTQSATAQDAVIIGFSVVPALLVALSLVPLARYRLRRGDIDGSDDRTQ